MKIVLDLFKIDYKTEDIKSRSHAMLVFNNENIFILAAFNYSEVMIYSYRLGSKTTAVLFDSRTDLLPEAQANGNRCVPRSNKTAVVLELSL